jgi:hypothetical protein
VPNDYDLAFFSALLFDPEKLSAKFFNGGWGCYYNRDIQRIANEGGTALWLGLCSGSINAARTPLSVYLIRLQSAIAFVRAVCEVAQN